MPGSPACDASHSADAQRGPGVARPGDCLRHDSPLARVLGKGCAKTGALRIVFVQRGQREGVVKGNSSRCWIPFMVQSLNSEFSPGKTDFLFQCVGLSPGSREEDMAGAARACGRGEARARAGRATGQLPCGGASPRGRQAGPEPRPDSPRRAVTGPLERAPAEPRKTLPVVASGGSAHVAPHAAHRGAGSTPPHFVGILLPQHEITPETHGTPHASLQRCLPLVRRRDGRRGRAVASDGRHAGVRIIPCSRC